MPSFDSRHDPALQCPACRSSGLTHFYQADRVPTSSNLLMQTRDEAIGWPRGDVRLAACPACRFITNTAFDPATQQLTARYEATQACSPTFGRFARQLAQAWIDRYSLAGKRLLEIGCGQGEFITMMCDMAGATGWGIDPIADPARSTGRARLLPEALDARHASLRPDFIFCRHTLEHIADVLRFCEVIHEVSRGVSDSVVAVEVPDTARVLREGAFWDIYYEHCSYFDSASLSSLIRRAGFDVIESRLEYAGQYLIIESRPAAGTGREEFSPPTGDAAPAEASPTDLPQAMRHLAATVEAWQSYFAARRARRVVLWGSGSKAVGFLTTLGIADQVLAVVDINPAKQGTFLPGSGHEIIPAERLRQLRPDAVIVMNPVYEREIRRSLDELGLAPEVVCLR